MKSIPKHLIRKLIDAHANATLRCRNDGILGPGINNNNDVGVFQGSPLSAQLFIIFADKVMGNYTTETNKQNLRKIHT